VIYINNNRFQKVHYRYNVDYPVRLQQCVFSVCVPTTTTNYYYTTLVLQQVPGTCTWYVRTRSFSILLEEEEEQDKDVRQTTVLIINTIINQQAK
jgi:hypothetical protein